MPNFRYVAGYSRIYVDRSLVVEPGDVVEWDEAPADGQWEPVDPPADDSETTDDDPSGPTTEEQDSAQNAPDASAVADAGAPKKPTRRAAPAQTSEE